MTSTGLTATSGYPGKSLYFIQGFSHMAIIPHPKAPSHAPRLISFTFPPK